MFELELNKEMKKILAKELDLCYGLLVDSVVVITNDTSKDYWEDNGYDYFKYVVLINGEFFEIITEDLFKKIIGE